MAVLALEMGLQWRDLRRMKYTHLMQLLLEWEDMHAAAREDGGERTVDADDFGPLLGL